MRRKRRGQQVALGALPVLVAAIAYPVGVADGVGGARQCDGRTAARRAAIDAAWSISPLRACFCSCWARFPGGLACWRCAAAAANVRAVGEYAVSWRSRRGSWPRCCFCTPATWRAPVPDWPRWTARSRARSSSRCWARCCCWVVLLPGVWAGWASASRWWGLFSTCWRRGAARRGAGTCCTGADTPEVRPLETLPQVGGREVPPGRAHSRAAAAGNTPDRAICRFRGDLSQRGLPALPPADINRDLIDLYGCLQRRAVTSSSQSAARSSRPRPTRAPSMTSGAAPSMPRPTRGERAKLFVYLNKHCYNGLCRYNSAGEFNVPFGRYRQIDLSRVGDARLCRNAQRWPSFGASHFAPCCLTAQPGDVVYCDPPYVPLSTTAHFTAYNASRSAPATKSTWPVPPRGGAARRAGVNLEPCHGSGPRTCTHCRTAWNDLACAGISAAWATGAPRRWNCSPYFCLERHRNDPS